MCIIVYSGETIIEQVICLSKEQLSKVAYYWREEGFKIKIVESLES